MIQRCISALKKSTLKSKAKRNETENFISERQGGSPERDYGMVYGVIVVLSR